MCNFLSAVVMKNGDLLCDPEHTDSHEDLLSKHSVRDGWVQQGGFVRVEFLPPKDHSKIFDTDAWTLKVDQKDTPDWFDKVKVQGDLAARVQRMFVRDERELLLGGCWILGEGAKITEVKNARIWKMFGNARVEKMYGMSQIERMHDTSQVRRLCDSSRVEGMWQSSRVEMVCDSSRIKEMHDSSRIEKMYESSQVEEMFDLSRVEMMLDASRVGEMLDSSWVGIMLGTSQIEMMYDSSQVRTMLEKSRMIEDKRDKE